MNFITCSYEEGVLEQKNDSLKLWYDAPAKIWVEALPLGNGCLEAMLFGGLGQERIQLKVFHIQSSS